MGTVCGMLAVLAALGTTASAQEGAIVRFESDGLTLALDARGVVIGMTTPGGPDLLDPARETALASVRCGDVRTPVSSATWHAASASLTLAFAEAGCTAEVGVAGRPTHLRFELLSLSGTQPEVWEWGPFYTTVRATIGETVGVVRDGASALGVQALNAHTIGGLAPERRGQPGRGQAATATETGASLQAYSVRAEGGMLGSAIALFACADARALETIGAIELAEGLPHPMWEGEWLKTSPAATRSYLICPFGESDIDAALDSAEAAGLRVLYHPGPFRTWGHFELDPRAFPNGDAGLAECSRKASERGIGIGLHTLTAFLTTNDPYVTPVPDPRLARWGTSTLSADLTADATEIAIADPAGFRERGTLGCAVLGEELVQYGGISAEEPWRLTEVRRGAFATTASAHPAGTDIGHLADHAYRTLFPGIDNGMAAELVARLVELYNTADLVQISFDGLEGLSQYGYGEWPRNTFVEDCYRGWDHEVINDASNLLHYLWHAHTRMNWGEPWGAAMREGMTEYRFANQAYFERNLFPKMLGWFQIRLASGGVPATSLVDVEWLLSKAAGYDAGFAISTSLPELAANGQSTQMLEAIRQWETARHAGAFTEEQKERLRRADSEWRLVAADGGGWTLTPIRVASFRYPEGAIQPGQPAVSTWDLDNPYDTQIPAVAIHVLPTASAALVDPVLSLGGREVTVRGEVAPGQNLLIDVDTEARLCDANGRLLAALPMDGAVAAASSGASRVEFSSFVTGAAPPECEVRLRLLGPVEAVARGR